jgi:hypothetical protein
VCGYILPWRLADRLRSRLLQNTSHSIVGCFRGSIRLKFGGESSMDYGSVFGNLSVHHTYLLEAPHSTLLPITNCLTYQGQLVTHLDLLYSPGLMAFSSSGRISCKSPGLFNYSPAPTAYSPSLNGSSPGHIDSSHGQNGYSQGQNGYSPGPNGYSPGHISYTPGHNGYSPGHNGYSPGHIGSSPGHIGCSPGHIYSLPGQNGYRSILPRLSKCRTGATRLHR